MKILLCLCVFVAAAFRLSDCRLDMLSRSLLPSRTIERYTDEVESVGRGLGLDHFYLLGHSWGACWPSNMLSSTSST